MVASYLDASSSSQISNVISYLRSANFSLGNGIDLRSATINDVTTVFKADTVVSPVSSNTVSDGTGSGSGSSSSLSESKTAVS